VNRLLAVLLALVVVGAAPAPALAQAQDPSLVTPLTVQPAREPTPALRYHLMPDLSETTPGNAALLYYRSFSPEWMTHMKPEVAKKLDAWSEKQTRVPPEEFRWVLTASALKEIDRAARREYCEWEMTPRLRKEGIGLLLPDVQAFRGFARVLQLRARFQILDGKHDDAAYTFQTGFKLAHDISNAPTLIQSLVGNALAAIFLKEVEEWIQTPGAPNLYWALTDLPRPFISLRKPLQGERLFLESVFPGLRETIAKRRVLSAAEAEKMIAPLAGLARDLNVKLSEVSGRLALAALAAKTYPTAQRALLAQGWTKEQLEAMTVLQTFMLHELLVYDSLYDDFVKWSSLPYWQSRPGLARVNGRLRATKGDLGLGGILAGLLLPAVDKVHFATVRLQRRIDALRIVEALRLHAALHDGKLPEKLSDITDVPIPPDPASGKSFDYKLDGGKATLTAPAPAGEKPNQSNFLRYEITLKK
jgi:hypothetical protein